MSSVNQLVDHLFRHQAGRMSAVLTRILGTECLDLVEEVVQDSLVQAMKLWPYRGIPDNPSAWLFRVAKNRALDVLRRRSSFREKESLLRGWLPEESVAPGDFAVFEEEVRDDLLRMMFTCCHPSIRRQDQVALTLKIVCGFGVAEIARAFLARKAAVAQRLVRAKRRLREEGIAVEVPDPGRLGERLDPLLDVLYLLFNEGFGAHQGEDLVRSDLCQESIRLVELLAAHPRTDRPKVRALAALMLFHTARLPARVRDGELVLLADQDRTLWNRELLSRGLAHFRRSIEGPSLTRYHVQASIASLHVAAPSYLETDWPAILSRYDQLVRIRPSPIFSLNRIVALSFVEGIDSALEELALLEKEGGLEDYHLLAATFADLHARRGDKQSAAEYYRQALQKECSQPERRFLRRKLAETLPARP